jgi:hypothetical protein
MNCQRFEEVVNDIARERIIDAAARAEALSHGDKCERCAGRLEDERAITLQLRGLAENMESAGAPERVEERLLVAFDNFAPTQFPARVVLARHYRPQYVIGAIAAVLLMVFGIFAIHWSVPANKKSAAPLISRTALPASTGISTTSPPPIVLQQPVRPAIQARKSSVRHRDGVPAKAPGANTGNIEIATDFIPVTYGGAANLADGGRMVRVELPRSAMASFGLPVNMDRANERVKADVLMGVDGLAHAIRFVR